MKFSMLKTTVLIGMASMASVALAAQGVNDQKATRVEEMYTQIAPQASVEPAKGHPGEYTLAMQGVSPQVTWFTNRPQRDAGKISTEKFVREWSMGKNSFSKDNPNASLTYAYNQNGVTRQGQGVFQLSSPRYIAATHTVIYRLRPVTDTLFKNIHALRDVSLFIDGQVHLLALGHPICFTRFC